MSNSAHAEPGPVDDFQDRINRVDTSTRNEYDLALIVDLHDALKEVRRAASAPSADAVRCEQLEHGIHLLFAAYLAGRPAKEMQEICSAALGKEP